MPDDSPIKKIVPHSFLMSVFSTLFRQCCACLSYYSLCELQLRYCEEIFLHLIPLFTYLCAAKLDLIDLALS